MKEDGGAGKKPKEGKRVAQGDPPNPPSGAAWAGAAEGPGEPGAASALPPPPKCAQAA